MSGKNAVSGGLAKPGERWVFGAYVSGRNALVLQVSSLIMVILCALLLVAASALIAGIRQGGSSGAARNHPWATVLVLISAVGLLLSSATIYLTYRPYWYIFQRAILAGDRSQAWDLREFLSAVRMPPGFDLGTNPRFNVPVYFWAGVTLPPSPVSPSSFCDTSRAAREHRNFRTILECYRSYWVAKAAATTTGRTCVRFTRRQKVESRKQKAESRKLRSARF